MTTRFKFIGILAVLLMISNQAYSQTNNDSLQLWAQHAAEEVMTFHFGDFEERKMQNKRFFTDSGYTEFYSALDRSNIPKAVSDNKYMLETKVLCLPQIVQKPSSENKFYVLKFPFQTTWIQGSSVKRDFRRMTMVVANNNNQNGNYGIEQWIASPIEESEASACTPNEYRRVQIEKLRKEIRQREEKIKQLESKMNE